MSADLTALGVAVGHATDGVGATGLTVVRGIDAPLRAAAAVLGRATGTRELDALTPGHLVDRVDAILLTGGSAYGLAAADGVMRWMEERGRGFAVPGGVVPIVPAAVIFDLAPLGEFTARPTAAMAYDACDRATPVGFAEGSVGAGAGATVGKGAGVERAMKGGIGCATVSAGEVVVAALAVVNALGDVRDGDGRILAGARDEGADGAGRRFVDVARQLASGAVRERRPGAIPHHTTLAVVATNVRLAPLELAQLARSASGALVRRITPAATSFDGDVVFGVTSVAAAVAAPAIQVEALAIPALESAIERAVRLARGRDGIPGLADEG